ncbi:MAG TPA: hypothetical protein VGO78_09575 [Acidimicrobiales bacterium]|nr:hypothetical protein [Acidimicrobiales bacterium]
MRIVVRPLLAAAAVVTALVVGTAGPAAADPPRPSDYRSTVTGMTPASEAVDVSVTGGDAFLRLRAAPGHEVVVLGYDDEPYLRFRPDGTVETNLESPATYVNTSLSGRAEIPADVDADDPPRWHPVADGGAYAWHDHRVHWMGSQPPVGVGRGDEVQGWTVPLRVDGRPVAVEGVLTYASAVAWWPWLLAVAAVAALATLLGRRAPGSTTATATATITAAACGVAVVLAAIEQLSIPAEAGRRWVPVLVPGVGVGLAVAALVLTMRRRRPIVARNLALAAIAAAAGWGALRLAVFTKPVLVTALAPGLDRAGTALVLGLAVAAAGLAVARSASGTAAAPDATGAAGMQIVCGGGRGSPPSHDTEIARDVGGRDG